MEVDGEQRHASCTNAAKPYETFVNAVSSEGTLSCKEEDCENLEKECSKVLEMINLVESPESNSICSFQNAVKDLASALNDLGNCSRLEEDFGTEGNCGHSSALINLGLNEGVDSDVTALPNGTGNCDDGNSCTQIKLFEKNEPVSTANPLRSQQEKAIFDHHGQSSNKKDSYPVKDYSNPEKTVSYDVISRELIECMHYTKHNSQEVDPSVRTNMNCNSDKQMLSYRPETEGDVDKFVSSEIFQCSSESKDKCVVSHDSFTLSAHTSGVDNCADNRDLRQDDRTTSLDRSDSVLPFKDTNIFNGEFEDSQAASVNRTPSSFDLNSHTSHAFSSTCLSCRKCEQSFGQSELVSSVSMNFKLNDKQDFEDFYLYEQKGNTISMNKSKEESKDFEKEVTRGLLQGSPLNEQSEDIQNVVKYTDTNDMQVPKVYIQETLSESKNREHYIGGHLSSAGDNECGEIDIPKVGAESDYSLRTPNNVNNDIHETSFELEKVPTCLKDEKTIHEKKKDNQDTTIKEKAASGQIYTPNITSLDISCISFHSKALGSACLKLFSESNTRLRDFSISWSQLDDDTLIHVLKSEPELQELSLVS